MNETLESTFPQTRHELNNLKNTAVEAAKDLGSTASVHAKKVQGNLQNVAAQAQREGGEQLDQVKSNLGDLAEQARDYVSGRPMAAIGVALAFGYLVGRFYSSRVR